MVDRIALKAAIKQQGVEGNSGYLEQARSRRKFIHSDDPSTRRCP